MGERCFANCFIDVFGFDRGDLLGQIEITEVIVVVGELLDHTLPFYDG